MAGGMFGQIGAFCGEELFSAEDMRQAADAMAGSQQRPEPSSPELSGVFGSYTNEGRFTPHSLLPGQVKKVLISDQEFSKREGE